MHGTAHSQARRRPRTSHRVVHRLAVRPLGGAQHRRTQRGAAALQPLGAAHSSSHSLLRRRPRKGGRVAVNARVQSSQG